MPQIIVCNDDDDDDKNLFLVCASFSLIYIANAPQSQLISQFDPLFLHKLLCIWPTIYSLSFSFSFTLFQIDSHFDRFFTLEFDLLCCSVSCEEVLQHFSQWHINFTKSKLIIKVFVCWFLFINNFLSSWN